MKTMDIQAVRGNTLRPCSPTSVEFYGEGKHSFKKILEEKSNINTKDIFSKSENVAEGKLTQAQKDELKSKFDITNMNYYSDDADKLFGTLRDLGLITEEDYMKTGNCPIFVDLMAYSKGTPGPNPISQLPVDTNLYNSYRSIAAQNSVDYTEMGFKCSKENVDYYKKISQVLFDVFMT